VYFEGYTPSRRTLGGLSLGERTSSYFKKFLHSHKKTMVYMPGGSVLVGSPKVGWGTPWG